MPKAHCIHTKVSDCHVLPNSDIRKSHDYYDTAHIFKSHIFKTFSVRTKTKILLFFKFVRVEELGEQ